MVKDFEEEGYICQFYKKIHFAKKFEATDEESYVKKEDFVRKLGPPISMAGSSRFKKMITFDDDQTVLTMY